MENEKYSNYPLSISAILGLIEANDIAIPEIQRPFVWKKTQVRDLIDSLYKVYPEFSMFDKEVVWQVVIETKYEGYIKKTYEEKNE